MPKPPPTAYEVASVLDPLLDHIKEAEKQLLSAAKLFSKMPRALPNGTRRLDKILPAVNQLSALRIQLIGDVHRASWCTDDLHSELEQIQKKNTKRD